MLEVVSSGFAVDDDSGFVVLAVVIVICPGFTVVTVVCLVVTSGPTVVGVVGPGFNVVSVTPVVVDSEVPVVGVVNVSGFAVVGVVCVLVVDCSGLIVVKFPGAVE